MWIWKWIKKWFKKEEVKPELKKPEIDLTGLTKGDINVRELRVLVGRMLH